MAANPEMPTPKPSFMYILSNSGALSHAKTLGKNGKTLFENNIMLMNLYKRDLHNLFLN
jgi:hypothetical protein